MKSRLASLALLGSSLICGHAVAQGPNGVVTADVRPAHAGSIDAARIDAARLAKGIADLEQAWLADPITFPYELRAVAAGPFVALQGVVPSDAIRRQVINVAKVHSPAPLLDYLHVAPVQTLGGKSAASPQELQKVVQTHLNKVMPEGGNALRVACREDGQVTLSGDVASWDARRAAARSMRAVPGCFSVVDQMRVVDPAANAGITPVRAEVIATRSSPMPGASLDHVRQIVANTCPELTTFRVEKSPNHRYLISFSAPNETSGTQLAARLLETQELRALKVEVRVQVPR